MHRSAVSDRSLSKQFECCSVIGIRCVFEVMPPHSSWQFVAQRTSSSFSSVQCSSEISFCRFFSFIRYTTGGSVHTILRKHQLVFVPAIAFNSVRTLTEHVRTCTNIGRRRTKLPNQSTWIDSGGIAIETDVGNPGGGLLSNIPRYVEEYSGRQYGLESLRRLITRNVRHSCVHSIHIRSGKLRHQHHHYHHQPGVY